MLKSKWFPSGEASLGQSIANISLNFPPSADGIIWRVRYLVTCARIVACPGVLLLNKYGWTFLKKHLGYATHPEHDSPSVTIGHLGNTNFNPQPKIQQSTSMQTHWQYATIAKHSSLEIVGYHVLAWFMPVSEGQCEGYSYLAAGPSVWYARVNWDLISRVAMLQKYLETSNQSIIAYVPVMYPIII